MAAKESVLLSAMVCSGCGHRMDPSEAEPFRCPERRDGDDIDHVLVRELSGPEPEWPVLSSESAAASTQPFVHFRRRLHSWRVAMANGLSDTEWCELVRRLDEGLAAVAGTGFVFTPYGRADELSSALGFASGGGVFLKDETGNVSGSHKARHLMGLALWFAVTERLGWPAVRPDAVLAIASCGNAALAAALVARAAQRQLQVFVPSGADEAVIDQLTSLRAEVLTCDRRAADPPGDSCLHRFHQAVEAGALPFSCQGSENGLVVEGGCTLAWELVSQHAAAGLAPLEHLFVQVGGGALASATGQGIGDAVRARVLQRGPRLHAVQTVGAAPLSRAWRRLVDEQPAGADVPLLPAAALRRAAQHRSRYMWPWETLPTSAATGILDDETYDWLAVLGAVAESDGEALVVSEEQIAKAHQLGRRHTGLDVSATGTAGLAGLLASLEQGLVSADERVAVLFTGCDR